MAVDPEPQATPQVLHQDAHLLVLLKPAGMPTTSPDPQADCLFARARQLDPGAPRLHPSSRLDAEVTGLVIFARTKRATQSLLAARQAGRYLRCYAGLCAAPPVPAVGRIEAPIARDPRDPRKRRVPAHPEPGAKPARSAYRVAAAGDGGCLLWLYPETGRTHQLRVHAAHCGAPLLGDRHYGGPVRVVRADGRVVRAPRVMLHCTWLRIPSPVGRGTLEFRSPLPDDMTHVFLALGGSPEALCEPPPLP